MSIPQNVPQTSGKWVPPIRLVISIILGPSSVRIKSMFEIVLSIPRADTACSTILHTIGISSDSAGWGQPCPIGIRRGGGVVMSLCSINFSNFPSMIIAWAPNSSPSSHSSMMISPDALYFRASTNAA